MAPLPGYQIKYVDATILFTDSITQLGSSYINSLKIELDSNVSSDTKIIIDSSSMVLSNFSGSDYIKLKSVGDNNIPQIKI